MVPRSVKLTVVERDQRQHVQEFALRPGATLDDVSTDPYAAERVRADTDRPIDRDSDSWPIATAVSIVDDDGPRHDWHPARRTGSRRRRWYAAGSAAVALAGLVLFFWPQLMATPKRLKTPTSIPTSGYMFSINRSVQIGGLDVHVSHAERLSAVTRLFVHLVNSSEQSLRATLWLGDGDRAKVHDDARDGDHDGDVVLQAQDESDAHSESVVVPPKSSVDRVVTVENGREIGSMSVDLQGERGERSSTLHLGP